MLRKTCDLASIFKLWSKVVLEVKCITKSTNKFRNSWAYGRIFHGRYKGSPPLDESTFYNEKSNTLPWIVMKRQNIANCISSEINISTPDVVPKFLVLVNISKKGSTMVCFWYFPFLSGQLHLMPDQVKCLSTKSNQAY